MNEGIPSTRTARLSIVERIIAENIVESQQQLVKLLSEEGISVTQATMSRDLEDIKASKVRHPSGVIAYAVPDSQFTALNQAHIDAEQRSRANQKMEQQLAKVIGGLITRVASAQNLVVIHTPPGAAQYLASAIDKHPIDKVEGTIAGDDTVLMITADNDAAQEKSEWLISIASDAR